MPTIQEIEEKLESASSPADRIDLLNELAEKTRTSDFSKSLQFSKDAVADAEKSANKKGMAKSYWNHGINLRLNSQYNEAFEYLEKGLKICKEIGDTNGEAAILNSIANIHANSGNYQKAIEYLNRSNELLQRINYKDLEASVLSNYGAIYHEMGDYSTALEYYLKSSLIHKEHLKDIPENLLNNIGEVYKMLGDYDTALEYYYKSLKLAREKNNKADESFALLNISLVYGAIKDIDKALMYLSESSQLLKELGFKQSDHISSKITDKDISDLNETDRALDFYFRVLTLRDEISDMNGKAQTLSTIGNIYFSSGKFQVAEKYFKESLKLSIDLGDKLNQVKNYLYLGILNNKIHQSETGFNYMNKALELAENIHAKKDMYEIHRAMYEGYKASGDLSEALLHLEKAYYIEKDVFNIESDKKLGNLSLKYESESAEKEKKIALQEKEIFKLKNVELADANEKLKFLNEEKNDFMGIAAHDLKNPLSGILSFSKKIQKADENIPDEQIKDFGKEIEKASEKMFEMITKMLDVTAIESGKRNINPENFEVSILAQRVKLDYYQKAEQKNIEVVFDSTEKIMVTLDKLALRQILDNIISNAIKFSPQGKKVYFRVTSQNDSILFSIKDEGPGLTEKDKTKLFGKFTRLSAQPTGGENSTGLGLSIARKLTEAMKGKIWVESEQGKGAEFFIELPLDLNK